MFDPNAHFLMRMIYSSSDAKIAVFRYLEALKTLRFQSSKRDIYQTFYQ